MKIYEFQKNVLEKVIVEITKFNGSDYLNLRTWFQDAKNVWRPSHKGITLSLDKIGELKIGIDLAFKEYAEQHKEADSDKRARLSP